jgi:hypothetical protein
MVIDMPKIQTRRCVSLKREIYDRIKAYCELNHISMSSFVEAALEANVKYLLEEGKAKAKETEQSTGSRPIATRPPGNVAHF